MERLPSIVSVLLLGKQDGSGAFKLLAFAAGQAGQSVLGNLLEERIDDAMGVHGFIVRILDHAEVRALRAVGDGSQARYEVEIERGSVADGIISEKCSGKEHKDFDPLASGEELQNADAE
jgi:hypothetical protein